MAASNQTLLCEICTKNGQTNVSIGCCSECREIYCDQCTKHHTAFKATQTHKILIFDSVLALSDHAYCDSCKKIGNKNIRASYFCGECRELYCMSCKNIHRIFKATSDHNLREINFSLSKQSVPKDSINVSSDFEKFIIPDENDSDSGSDTFQYQINRVSSSCVEELNLPQNIDNDNLAAQFHCPHLIEKGFKMPLKTEEMEKISANIIGSFNAKISIGKRLLNLKLKLQPDKDHCWFCGIISLKDGRFLLLDYINDKLKMFDKDYNLISTKRTRVTGLGMTKVSEKEIAVVTYDTVYFYQVTKNRFKLNKQRNIKLGSKGVGISYNRGMFAVLCDDMVKFYSKSGEEMTEISPLNCERGSSITLDTEEDRIYILSLLYEEKPFSCISQQGNFLWKYAFCGQDVVEFYNYLLVTNSENNAIILCAKDGSYSRTLIQDKENLKDAEYLAYNPDKQQLYVTTFFSHKIIIIQLQNNPVV